MREIYLWILRVCAGAVVLLILAGSIAFPIEASRTKCGFQLSGDSITMKKFNGTVVNSTISNNPMAHENNMPIKNENYIGVTCSNLIEITTINHTCNLIVYDGESILNCIESIFPNGKTLEIFIEGMSEKCYLHNLSRDCNKSNIYSKIGTACIITLCIFIVIFFCALSNATQKYRDDVDRTLYYRKAGGY